MADDAKRQAQEALYAAIQDQAENNMKAAMPASQKGTLLRELAEAYRLTAGGAMPVGTGRPRKVSSAAKSPKKSSESPSRRERRES